MYHVTFHDECPASNVGVGTCSVDRRFFYREFEEATTLCWHPVLPTNIRRVVWLLLPTFTLTLNWIFSVGPFTHGCFHTLHRPPTHPVSFFRLRTVVERFANQFIWSSRHLSPSSSLLQVKTSSCLPAYLYGLSVLSLVSFESASVRPRFTNSPISLA